MKMGPKASYLCIIPPPPADNASVSVDESSTDVTPVHSWSLLQPLSGSCLYVRTQHSLLFSSCKELLIRDDVSTSKAGSPMLTVTTPTFDNFMS